ncbi:flagellar basal body P-ring formation chaperone FlgA [Dyella choica]|uniref:Flagella basal body P-ring formation protein FlgA n=1 Tax=Dyella choica TaxID=1927959 RepID=A0A3S0RYJ1_9GAMM|nr:flagellar basal body P-ring formation chaperone FlgA [Dyella choica]RUL72731.1 flagellar basal body P-ring formation protein FlgA [Dyella choica]
MRKLLPAILLLAVHGSALASSPLQTVTAARIVDVAQAQLDACLGGDKATAQVAVVGRPEDVQVLAGKLALKARKPEGRWPRARVSVPVDITVNDAVVRSTTVWFALSVQHDVSTYISDAAIGAAASTLKFAPHAADVAALQGTLVSDPHQLDGMRLRHAVLTGSPVVLEDFERIPDVDRQQRVEVMASYGVIRLQAKGTAVGRGNAGDTVLVQVDGAEAPVRARITDRGVVQVVD